MAAVPDRSPAHRRRRDDRLGPAGGGPPGIGSTTEPGPERGAIRRMVIEWLREMLLKSDMPIQRVNREAQQCGFSAATLRRAREALKVRMFRDAGGPFSSGWWTLRPKDWKGGAVPVGCPYDAVMLEEIQNWEGEAVGKRDMQLAERDGNPAADHPAEARDVRRLAPDVSPAVGSSRLAVQRACALQPAANSRELDSDVESPLSEAEWGLFREPLVAAVLAGVNEDRG